MDALFKSLLQGILNGNVAGRCSDGVLDNFRFTFLRTVIPCSYFREEVAAEPSDQPSTINDESPAQTHHKFRLCFNGSLKSTIYTNRPLQGQSNREIEIAICADDQIITSGRLASLSVEIVALENDHSCRGQWTEEDFDRQIRKSRDGQGSVLDGECVVELVNGKASLGNIRFKEHSTGTRSREFVLAARVCRSENIRVEEAFMHPPFVVLVERSKGKCFSNLQPKIHFTLPSSTCIFMCAGVGYFKLLFGLVF